MPGAHETLEHAEHASHAGHGGGSGKLIGLTMALIGVLIALGAAMVGSERNELTRTMIDQTQAHSDYTGASTKFRIVMIELEKQRTSSAVGAEGGGDTAQAKLAHSVLERFIRLYTDYAKERKYSKEWADSFAPLIDAHFEAAEGYERAQLIAEIGIVIASLAVLLNNKPAWIVSMILGALSIGQMAHVYVRTKHEVGESFEKMHHAEEGYKDLRKSHVGANEDERTVEQLDPGGKIRGALEASDKAAEGAAHGEGHGEAHPHKE